MLFGHNVGKSHKAWQTRALYSAQISEVHQTHRAGIKIIWACRYALGHPDSKRFEAKIWISAGDIQEIQLVDYKIVIDYKIASQYKL